MYVKKDFWGLVNSRPLLDHIPENELELCSERSGDANKVTVDSWKKIWLSNIKSNEDTYNFKDNSIKQLSKKHLGKTAYLVGNGPSLKNNVKELKDKDGIIITNTHSLRFLLDNGITPDYVVGLDARHKTSKWLKGIDTSKLEFLSDIIVHPKTLKTWKGKVYFYRSMLNNDNKDDIGIDKITDFTDFISCGGNCMGAAYSIANGMGCNRIVFVGMDLSNGFIHKVNYADGEIDSRTGSDSCIVPDVSGRGCFTLLRMYMYKAWLDIQSKNQPVEHINATEGGILGAYTGGNLSSIKQMRLVNV